MLPATKQLTGRIQNNLKVSSRKISVLLIMALTAVFVLLFYREAVLTTVLSSLEILNAHKQYTVVAIFLLIWLATTTALIPASALVVVAGSTSGIGEGFLISMAGVFAGALSAFHISRGLLHDPIRRRLSGRFPVEVLESEIRSRGWKIVALLRLSPVFPFSLVSYAFGISGVKRKDFLIGTVGSIPPILGYLYAGGITRDTLYQYGPDSSGAQPLEIAILGIQVLAVLVAMYVILKITRNVLRNIGLA